MVNKTTLPGFLRSLVKSARESKKPWVLAWPEEPVKDDSGELWVSTCNRYAVKRRKSDVYAIAVDQVEDKDVRGSVIAQNCKGVVGGMAACANHLAETLKQEEPKPEVRQEKQEVRTHHASTTKKRDPRQFMKTWGPRKGDGVIKTGSGSEAHLLFETLIKYGPLSIRDLANKCSVRAKRIPRHIRFWIDKGAPFVVENGKYRLEVS
jgi:hypothetical protein